MRAVYPTTMHRFSPPVNSAPQKRALYATARTRSTEAEAPLDLPQTEHSAHDRRPKGTHRLSRCFVFLEDLLADQGEGHLLDPS